MSVRAAVRRHRWAVAAIVVASWGWALFWPQGPAFDFGRRGGGTFQDASGEHFTASYAYVVHGWGVHGALRKGTNAVSVERLRRGVSIPLSPAEARELIEQHYGGDALGRGGWFVHWQAFALACSVATLLSVVSSAWWISFRTPTPLGANPGPVAIGVLGLAIWPALLGIPLAVWTWRALGSVEPRGVAVLHPEWMLVGTVYLVSAIAVALARPRPATTT